MNDDASTAMKLTVCKGVTMGSRDWDVEIYKVVDPNEKERRFVVITTIGDTNPVVHFCASREEAERSKYRTLEILCGVRSEPAAAPKS